MQIYDKRKYRTALVRHVKSLTQKMERLYNRDMEPEQKLRLFVRRVEELGRSKMVKEEMGYNFSLNYNQMSSLTVRLDEPDEEALRSFLLTFRQFISPKEPVYINQIYNLCHKHLKANNEIRDHLAESRKVWARALKTGAVELEFNEAKLSPEDVADLWLNGHYFHNDALKYERLENMLAGFGSPLIRAHFHQFLIEGARVIAYVGNVVVYAFNHRLFRF